MKNLKFFLLAIIFLSYSKSSNANRERMISIEEKVKIDQQKLEVLKSKVKLQVAELKFKNNIQ